MEDKLLQCPLFKGQTKENIAHLFQQVEFQLLSFQKNDLVVMENDICQRLLIVLEGSVRGEMTDFSGKVIKIEDIDACRPLAPAFLFGQKNRYPVSITANSKVKILALSQDATLKLFQLDRHFLVNFLNMISNRAQFLSQKIKFLSFQTIKGKLAHYLLQFDKEKKSLPFNLPVSQQGLSELFGVARPSLGRAIREMNDDGIIEANGKQVRILNYMALSDLLK